MSSHLSLRIPEESLSRLASRAERTRQPPRTLAQRYIEEGLRRDEHPLIVFVDGPAGRRPALLGTGLDVWEVIATVRDNEGDAEEAAGYLSLPAHLVQAAITYYGAFKDEVDRWIEVNVREAEEGRRAWEAGRRALET